MYGIKEFIKNRIKGFKDKKGSTREVLYRIRYYLKEIGWWVTYPTKDEREMAEGIIPLIWWSLLLAQTFEFDIDYMLERYGNHLLTHDHTVELGENKDPDILELPWVAPLADAKKVRGMEVGSIAAHLSSYSRRIKAIKEDGKEVYGYYIGRKDGKYRFYTTDEEVVNIRPETMVVVL